MTELTRIDPVHDLRHRPVDGGRMRDSLFWQTVLPGERLALQVYLFVTGSGAAGYNVALWGGDPEPLALERGGGRVGPDVDFDDFAVGSVRVQKLVPLRTSRVTVRGEGLEVDLDFEGLHDAFSFRDNPDGLPEWFADDRLEQTGRISGSVRYTDAQGAARVVPLGPLGHRDHSWGLRDWRAPQHWKWFVAYTPSGRAVNGWIWQARGEWGFAGYVLRAGALLPVTTIEQETRYDAAHEQRGLRAVLHDVNGGSTVLELDVFGILRLPDDRTGTTVLEGAATARIDGEEGVGQFGTEWPTAYLAHLVES